MKVLNQTVISTVGELMENFARILNCTNTGRTYSLDGQCIDLLDFLRHNTDMSLDELKELSELQPGNTMPIRRGHAAPIFELRRNR